MNVRRFNQYGKYIRHADRVLRPVDPDNIYFSMKYSKVFPPEYKVVFFCGINMMIVRFLDDIKIDDYELRVLLQKSLYDILMMEFKVDSAVHQNLKELVGTKNYLRLVLKYEIKHFFTFYGELN